MPSGGTAKQCLRNPSTFRRFLKNIPECIQSYLFRELPKIIRTLPKIPRTVTNIFEAHKVFMVLLNSAGVGRTGVFCALSVLIERLKSEAVVDVFQTVKQLRAQRPAMVQTKVRSVL